MLCLLGGTPGSCCRSLRLGIAPCTGSMPSGEAAASPVWQCSSAVMFMIIMYPLLVLLSEPEWYRGNANVSSSSPSSGDGASSQGSHTAGSNVLSYMLLLRVEHTYAPGVTPPWLTAARAVKQFTAANSKASAASTNSSVPPAVSAPAPVQLGSTRPECLNLSAPIEPVLLLSPSARQYLEAKRLLMCKLHDQQLQELQDKPTGPDPAAHESHASSQTSTSLLSRAVTWSSSSLADGSTVWSCEHTIAPRLLARDDAKAEHDQRNPSASHRSSSTSPSSTCELRVLEPTQQRWVTRQAVGSYMSPLRAGVALSEVRQHPLNLIIP